MCCTTIINGYTRTHNFPRRIKEEIIKTKKKIILLNEYRVSHRNETKAYKKRDKNEITERNEVFFCSRQGIQGRNKQMKKCLFNCVKFLFFSSSDRSFNCTRRRCILIQEMYNATPRILFTSQFILFVAVRVLLKFMNASLICIFYVFFTVKVSSNYKNLVLFFNINYQEDDDDEANLNGNRTRTN